MRLSFAEMVLAGYNRIIWLPVKGAGEAMLGLQ